jgi:hypothetical protein
MENAYRPEAWQNLYIMLGSSAAALIWAGVVLHEGEDIRCQRRMKKKSRQSKLASMKPGTDTIQTAWSSRWRRMPSSPDVAMVHSRFRISGDIGDDGKPESRDGCGIRVLHKRDGHWFTVAVQNTDVRHRRT